MRNRGTEGGGGRAEGVEMNREIKVATGKKQEEGEEVKTGKVKQVRIEAGEIMKQVMVKQLK